MEGTILNNRIEFIELSYLFFFLVQIYAKDYIYSEKLKYDNGNWI